MIHKRVQIFILLIVLLDLTIVWGTDKSVGPETNHDNQHDSEAENYNQELADHNDPINQTRMAIFHYNEGNKYKNKWNTQNDVSI